MFFNLALTFYLQADFPENWKTAGCRDLFPSGNVLPRLHLYDRQMAPRRNEISTGTACQPAGAWHAGKACTALYRLTYIILILSVFTYKTYTYHIFL